MRLRLTRDGQPFASPPVRPVPSPRPPSFTIESKDGVHVGGTRRYFSKIMQKEKLIEEVRKYPLLYDLSDPKYSDVHKKEKAWNEIAIVLSQPASECKKIWQNLREYHRRAIKKKATKSGQSANTNKKWQYETEMSFLLPHYKERSTVTSVDNTDDGDDENSLSAAEILANVTNNEESQDSSIISERPESSVSMYDSSRSVFPDIPKTTKRKKLQETSASAVLMEYLLKNKNDEDGKQNDEMDKFFLSISSTVKKLSTYNQALLKSRIFNLVSEAEIQELQNNRNCYYDDFFAPGTSGYTTQNLNAGTTGSSYTTQNLNAGTTGSSYTTQNLNAGTTGSSYTTQNLNAGTTGSSYTTQNLNAGTTGSSTASTQQQNTTPMEESRVDGSS